MAAVSLFWDMQWSIWPSWRHVKTLWHSALNLNKRVIYSTTNIIVKSKNQKSAIFFTNPSSTLPWPEVPSARQTRIICVTLLFSLCVFSFVYFCFCRKHQLQNLPAAASICHCPWPTLAFEWMIVKRFSLCLLFSWTVSFAKNYKNENRFRSPKS